MEMSDGGENWDLGRGHVPHWPWLGVEKRLDPPQTLVLLGPAQGQGSQTKLTGGAAAPGTGLGGRWGGVLDTIPLLLPHSRSKFHSPPPLISLLTPRAL